MKNKIKKKKLVPLALVGVIAGATTFGAIRYLDKDSNSIDVPYFFLHLKTMLILQESILLQSKMIL